MSLYNISTLETRNTSSSKGWDTNLDQYRINQRQKYDPIVIEHGLGNHIHVLDNAIEPAPPSVNRFIVSSNIDSSTLSNEQNTRIVIEPLTNLLYNYNFVLARPGRPIHNSSPGWRYYKWL